MNLSRIEGIVEECFKRSTVKLGFLLDSNDNQIMLKNYARYKGAVEETDIISYYTSLELTDFTGTDLAAIPNIYNAKACMLTPSKVYEFLDAVGVERVLQNVRKRTIEEYVEKNSYVRILAGLPSLNDTELVYIPEIYRDLVSDHTKPIHLMSDEDLEKLYSRGVLTELADKFPNKVYINYLHRRSTIISIRDAADFELIHAGVIPGEELLSSTFKERWRLNREYFINSHHNVFYQRTTDYYEALISMIIAWSVRVDMVRDSGFDIENDYYDDYELAAILQDFSLSLDGLPADIKRKVAANMSILVRNRGTVKVLENLCDIFDMKNVYNYVIQKIYVNGKAEIRCHAVPVKDMKNMRKYLTREYGYITYDKLISGDQTFSDKGMSARTTRTIEKKGTTDGYINTYHALLDKDFSYIHSKYVAVDNFIDMSQTSLDFALFYNYVLDADPLIGAIQVKHKLGNFKLTLVQLYAYLCTLLSWKYHFVDNVAGSTEDIRYVLGLNHKLNLRKAPIDITLINNDKSGSVPSTPSLKTIPSGYTIENKVVIGDTTVYDGVVCDCIYYYVKNIKTNNTRITRMVYGRSYDVSGNLLPLPDDVIDCKTLVKDGTSIYIIMSMYTFEQNYGIDYIEYKDFMINDSDYVGRYIALEIDGDDKVVVKYRIVKDLMSIGNTYFPDNGSGVFPPQSDNFIKIIRSKNHVYMIITDATDSKLYTNIVILVYNLTGDLLKEMSVDIGVPVYSSSIKTTNFVATDDNICFYAYVLNGFDSQYNIYNINLNSGVVSRILDGSWIKAYNGQTGDMLRVGSYQISPNDEYVYVFISSKSYNCNYLLKYSLITDSVASFERTSIGIPSQSWMTRHDNLLIVYRSYNDIEESASRCAIHELGEDIVKQFDPTNVTFLDASGNVVRTLADVCSVPDTTRITTEDDYRCIGAVYDMITDSIYRLHVNFDINDRSTGDILFDLDYMYYNMFFTKNNHIVLSWGTGEYNPRLTFAYTIDEINKIYELTLVCSLENSYNENWYNENSGYSVPNPFSTMVELKDLSGAMTFKYNIDPTDIMADNYHSAYDIWLPDYTGEPIISIDDVTGMRKPIFEYTTPNIPPEPEATTIDLVHIFEANFSGTEYMFLLSEWMTYNPGGTLDDFMNVYSSDRKFLTTIRRIMDETYDNDQYAVCKMVLERCTILNAKNTAFGTFTKYSEYIASVNPEAHTYLKKMKITQSYNWSEVFSNEIAYVLRIMKDFITTLNNGSYDDSMLFLEDIRDMQLNEVKNVLSYLVSYFLSMSTTIRDPEFTFEIGDETDAFKIRESISKQFSDKKLNNFSPFHEDLSIARTRELEPDNYYIKDTLYISHGINSKRYTKIGGDYEH